jgi:hypothetical protein
MSITNANSPMIASVNNNHANTNHNCAQTPPSDVLPKPSDKHVTNHNGPALEVDFKLPDGMVGLLFVVVFLFCFQFV